MIQVGDAATFTDDWSDAAGTADQYMSVAKGANLVNVQATLDSAFIQELLYAYNTVPQSPQPYLPLELIMIKQTESAEKA